MAAEFCDRAGAASRAGAGSGVPAAWGYAGRRGKLAGRARRQAASRGAGLGGGAPGSCAWRSCGLLSLRAAGFLGLPVSAGKIREKQAPPGRAQRSGKQLWRVRSALGDR